MAPRFERQRSAGPLRRVFQCWGRPAHYCRQCFPVILRVLLTNGYQKVTFFLGGRLFFSAKKKVSEREKIVCVMNQNIYNRILEDSVGISIFIGKTPIPGSEVSSFASYKNIFRLEVNTYFHFFTPAAGYLSPQRIFPSACSVCVFVCTKKSPRSGKKIGLKKLKVCRKPLKKTGNFVQFGKFWVFYQHIYILRRRKTS